MLKVYIMNTSFAVINTTARTPQAAKVPSLNFAEDLLSAPVEIVHDIVEEICFVGSLIVQEHLVDKKANPFGVKTVINTLVSVVESRFVRKEVFDELPWAESPEPIPSSIDPWSRNVIPVLRRVKIIPSNNPLNQSTALKSVKSMKSRASAVSHLKKQFPSSKLIPETFSIQEEVSKIPEPIKPPESIELKQARREKKLKVLKKQQKLENERKLLEEEKETEKKIQKEEEKFKGKVLTYDYKGNIITVNPLVFGNSFQEVQPVKLMPEVEEAEEIESKKPRFQRKALSTPKKQKNFQYENEWVKNVKTRQMNILEHMSLSPNVTVTQNNRTIYPPKPLENLGMSRKQYLLSITPQRQQIEPMAETDNRSVSFSSFKQDSVEKMSKKNYFDNIPDYEDIQNTVISETVSPFGTSPINGQQYGRIIHYATENKINLVRPVDRFNLEILGNQHWGANPPLARPSIVSRVPHKLNLKQIREIYGNLVKKPKDLPFMTVEELWRDKSEIIKKPKDRPYLDKVIKKKKMPPPPLGQSMFNGSRKT